MPSRPLVVTSDRVFFGQEKQHTAQTKTGAIALIAETQQRVARATTHHVAAAAS